MAQTAEQKVLSAMKKAGAPVKAGDVAKVTGIDGKEVTRIMGTLKKEGKIVSPKRCYYEPA